MNMFARFDENPAMTLQVIKKNKMLRTDGRMHGRTDNVKTVYPPQTKFAGGIKKILMTNGSLMKVESIAFPVFLRVAVLLRFYCTL